MEDKVEKVYFCGRELEPGDLIYGLWYKDLGDVIDDEPPTSAHSNITAMLIDQPEKKQFIFAWRMRLYSDDSTGPENDDRRIGAMSVMSYSDCPTREDAIKKCEALVKQWNELWGEALSLHTEFVSTEWKDISGFTKQLIDKPPSFLHKRKPTPEDIERMGKSSDPFVVNLAEKAKEQRKRDRTEEGRKRFRL